MSSGRNILFIGIYQRYIGATNYYLPAILHNNSNLFCYGPGYVSNETLEKGLDKYVESIGTVDFIVVTAQCIITTDLGRFVSYLKNFTAVFNSGNVSQYFLNDVSDFCRRNKRRVICGISEVDPHVTTQLTLDRLLEHSSYFLGWGNGFLKAKSDMVSVEKEEYIQKKLAKGFSLGLMDDFSEKHPESFINLGHCVAENEFYWGALSTRKFDVAVPGSGYARRRSVESQIKAINRIKLARSPYARLFKIANRIGVKPFSNFLLINIYNLAFQLTLSQSKVCITEGGANNYPVRKFFEIPAAGAVLMCWPASGMEALGFVDGVNSIFLDKNDDALSKLVAVLEEPQRHELIASAGRELVFRKHSVSARSLQLSIALKKIEEGRFHGSFWKDGDFSCIERFESKDRKVIELSLG